MSSKPIYSLSEYDSVVSDVGQENISANLGIKGANLADLIKNDFPVPKGFVITPSVLKEYYGNTFQKADSLQTESKDNAENQKQDGEEEQEGETEENQENQDEANSSLSNPTETATLPEITDAFWQQVIANVKKLEESTGKQFGGDNPLFLCVRPSPINEIPHLIESVFNIGFTQDSIQALANKSQDPKSVWTMYQEMIRNYGISTANVPNDKFDEIINDVKGEKEELENEDYPTICTNFKELIQNETENPYPEDVYHDLKTAIQKVFDSWKTDKVTQYLQENSIDQGTDFPAVIIEESILNAKTNSITTRDPTTGQGGPPNFEGVDDYPQAAIDNLVELMKKLDSHYKESEKFTFLADLDNQIWITKFEVLKKPEGLESELKFIVNYVKEGILTKEDALNKLDLNTFMDNQQPFVSDEDLRAAMSNSKQDEEQQEPENDDEDEIEEEDEDRDEPPSKSHRRKDRHQKQKGRKEPKEKPEEIGENELVRGIVGSPGFSVAALAFSADKAAEFREGEQEYIYIAKTCTPEDFETISRSKGIITYDASQGTSFAAAVAAYMNIPCVIGCPKKMKLDMEEMAVTYNKKSVHEGDTVTLAVKDDIASVFIGSLPLQQSEISNSTLIENPDVQQIIQWGDELRDEKLKPYRKIPIKKPKKNEDDETEDDEQQQSSAPPQQEEQPEPEVEFPLKAPALMIYATTDNAEDAAKARTLGAEGVGLCNTDQMLLGERTDLIQRLLIGHNEEEDRDATRQEIEEQVGGDYSGLLDTMNGYPVFFRLSDTQVKEYLPDVLELIEEMTIMQFKKSKGEEVEEEDIHEKRVTLEGTKFYYDENPLVGLRGMRLLLSVPGLLRSIFRGILESAYSAAEKDTETFIYVTLPFVTCPAEIDEARKVLDLALPQIVKEHQDSETEIKPVIKLASMIEVPRAALIADQLAAKCDALLFNMDILAQQSCTIDLAEAETTFLPQYALMHVFDLGAQGRQNPLTNLDFEGVSKILEIGLQKAKEGNSKILVGVTGKQCNTPEAISYFTKLGFDFVSVDVDSLPIVRLAAAKAIIQENV